MDVLDTNNMIGRDDSSQSGVHPQEYGISHESATRLMSSAQKRTDLSHTVMQRRFLQIPTRATSVQPSSPYKRPPLFVEYQPIVRKIMRQGDKSKGLRHFSTKVCEKVKEKGTTNYNEVADELVAEYFDSSDVPPGDSQQQYDMKNIRRRVYDALNVLMAMNIIEKEKKEIRWVGLPTSSIQECRKLEQEKQDREDSIRQKSEHLHELIIQLVSYKTLVERNREEERKSGRPAENSILYLPFIVVNTEKQTMVDCAISYDKTEYLFSFNQPFEIHDDIEILKRLGFAHGLERRSVNLEKRDKIKSFLPPILREYIDQMCTDRGHDITTAGEVNLDGNPSRISSEDKEAIYSSIPVGRYRLNPSTISHAYDDHLHQKPSQQQILQRATNVEEGRLASTSSYVIHSGASSSHHRHLPGTILTRQYAQQVNEGHSRGYSRQAAYSIQMPDDGQMHDAQFSDVYDDCEENLTFQ